MLIVTRGEVFMETSLNLKVMALLLVLCKNAVQLPGNGPPHPMFFFITTMMFWTKLQVIISCSDRGVFDIKSDNYSMW